MRICLFHPVLLPPRDYGGVERVVLWLAQGLLERGHEVTIAALEGSVLPRGVRLHAVAPGSTGPEDVVHRLPAELDVVHFMAPPGERAWDRIACVPILTVHGNGKPGERFPRNTVFLSRNHAERHSASCYVHNGVNPDEYLFEPGSKEDWHLFLSKTGWRVKNARGAARVCKGAGVRLKIAGGDRPWSLRLRAAFSRRLQWVGPVGGRAKAELLARAKALVFPVVWPEPFGLVVVESLISGTPVFASRRGSLPELVPPDAGVLLGSDEREWMERLRAGVGLWEPERCRDWAMRRFHYAIMAENYEQVYRRVLAGESLNPREPKAGDWRQEQ